MIELPSKPPPIELVEKIEEINGPLSLRSEQYDMWQYQLDLLWHDIDNNKLGEDAKTGLWYNHIKSIKESNPKVTAERKAILESEIQEIFNSS